MYPRFVVVRQNAGISVKWGRFLFYRVRGMLYRYMSSITAKKSLGQHFLRSKTALVQIITAANLSTDDTVLEVGPGEGILTDALLASGARVIAVETDERCIPILHERFQKEISEGRFILLEGDIRNEDIQTELSAPKLLGNAPYKLVANIPYYITGMLFRLFLEHLRQPSLIIFLVQKEVADEIVSRDGKEGILSLAIKIYGTPRMVSKVKREAFSPPPKVDSAIIAVEDISRTRLGTMTDDAYFTIVKAGLHARRKMLLGNLVHKLDIPKERIAETFVDLGIPVTVRGEDLPAEKWIALAQALTEKTSQKKLRTSFGVSL